MQMCDKYLLELDNIGLRAYLLEDLEHQWSASRQRSMCLQDRLRLEPPHSQVRAHRLIPLIIYQNMISKISSILAASAYLNQKLTFRCWKILMGYPLALGLPAP